MIMHDFLWLTLNWHWLVFVILLAIAIGIWVVTTRVGYFGFSIWGALAVSFVLYYGVVWELSPWVPGLFQFCWIVGFVAALVALAWYHWIVELVASVATGIAMLIVTILVLWQAIFVPVWNWLPIGHEIGAGNVSRFQASEPSVPNPEEPTESTSPSATTSAGPSASASPSGSPNVTVGTAPCEDITWNNVSTEIPAGAKWSTRDLIADASTGVQAVQAFKDWYDWALDNSAVYYRLAVVVKADPPAESSLVVNNHATSAFSCLADRVHDRLNHAVCYPEHMAIHVVLPDGTEFRVMRSTGQVQ
jgi:hypothetical protein